MRYYNIHTHQKQDEENIISIYNLTEEEMLSSITKYKHQIFFSAGIHPWHIKSRVVDIPTIKQLADSRLIVAIGEVGLDKQIDTPLHLQIDTFRQQIELAEDSKLPLIIHCVRAWDELILLYKEYKPTQAWIIHGFRGGKQQAEQLKSLGFYFSIGEHYNAESLSVIYPTHMFIETDESRMPIENIYANIAKDINSTVAELQAKIEQNVSSVFNISK